MADFTANVECPGCGEVLDVPVNIVSSKTSTTPGHQLVTVEPDLEFIAEHQATHVELVD